MAAAQSTLNISGWLQTQGGSALEYTPRALVSPYAVAASFSVALTTTPQLVTLPANTQWFGVQPPPNNTVSISHKWASGDIGSKINTLHGIPCLGVDQTGLTFYLWAASNVTVTVWSA